MKLFVCLFLFLSPTLNFDFKKNILSYSIVISKADLIVDGTISNVSKDRYEFTISQFIKGKSDSKINVTIWKEWMCDGRVSDLKKGQKLLLFLEKTSKSVYYPINESTGELFLEKDNSPSPSMYRLERFPNGTVIKKGIKMFLETYQAYGNLNDRFLQNVYFQSNKSIFEIYKMKEDNKFFKYLVDNEMQYYTVK
ncbi:hypothetical protein NJT12_19190 [Flavobacterium sp. AC]|uniref:DUF4369 domain-containing protein n=1 Tax=Flavobacterium azizsancarii TaxID=2961580 RepID=A0ABT4WI49_9FLAO|nr:hypothetical protein [Flavobacterium azizsancarii]MDA6071755.1 hypothetical protein [Flavobacterium azizsancarii]